MTTIEIELPNATAQAARAAALLTPQALDRLLTDALKRQAAVDSLLRVADRVAAADIAPMSMNEVNAEVKAARAERRQRAGHRATRQDLIPESPQDSFSATGFGFKT
jgi:hypothetical protein